MGLLIMKDYLAIIRKLDFVDLFKYGQLNISQAVPFEGNIALHCDDDELFNALTCRMNMYEYSFEYLIIHFVAGSDKEQYFTLDIKNVRNIYTFDEDAKKEMSISFDPRIQLHVAPWADKFEELKKKLSIKQSLRGINNLWTILDLPESDLAKCEKIITSDIIQEVFRELYENQRPSGEQSIWTYLLRYERHSFYPHDMKGYFCDFIHVFCNYLRKQELEDNVAETTQLYALLMGCQDMHFASLSKIVESSQLFQKSEEVTGCRFAIVAPMFLFFKNEYADGIKIDKKTIDYSRNIGGFEFSIVAYLLGISLGYDKTYDAFYESAHLPFLKKQVAVEIPSKITSGEENAANGFPQSKEESKQQDITNDSETGCVSPENAKNQEESDMTQSTAKQSSEQTYIQGELPFLSDEDCNKPSQQLPIQWMRKNAKQGKSDIRPAYNEEELLELNGLGYKSLDRYDSSAKEAIKTLGFDPDEERKRLTKTKRSNKSQVI